MGTRQVTLENEITLGPLEAIPLGQGHAYVVDGHTIAVFRQRDGRLFAAQHECPHRRGPLADGIVGAGKVICPLHARKFDLNTGACLGETCSITTYPVREEGGRIILTLG